MINKTVIEILEDMKSVLSDLKNSNEEYANLLGSIIQDDVAYIKSLTSDKPDETAGRPIGVGTQVSWTDHTGTWSGKVVEVHYAKVRRMVRNISSYKDGLGYEREITRVGTAANPVLFIQIDGGDGGTALIPLRSLQIDELVLPGK